ncbi:hypothetical protein VTI74DRAFT_11109 [Chaetomium olivicolor]
MVFSIEAKMPSFQGLPFELVECIAESLCLHCTPRPSCQCSPRCVDVSPNSICYTRRDVPSWDPKARSHALGALCLTSRRLKDAAMRHLYHSPKTKRRWLLARTLLRHPHLAQHVKTLYFPEFLDECEKSAIPSEVLSYYQIQLDSYSKSMAEDERLERDNYIWEDYGINDLITMVASLCPMVEAVEAVVSYDIIFHLCPPASLQSLHTAELAYWDTENGMSLESLIPLFKAAPNLSVLRCRSVSDEGGEDLGLTLATVATVKQVEFFNSAMSADALRALLMAFPGLETFRYEAGGACVGYEQFNPSQARDLMMEHGWRLKRVAIDLVQARGTWDFMENEWNDWDEKETEEVVKAFQERGMSFEVEF